MLEVSSFAFVKGPKEVKIKYFYTQKHRENKPFFPLSMNRWLWRFVIAIIGTFFVHFWAAEEQK